MILARKGGDGRLYAGPDGFQLGKGYLMYAGPKGFTLGNGYLLGAGPNGFELGNNYLMYAGPKGFTLGNGYVLGASKDGFEIGKGHLFYAGPKGLTVGGLHVGPDGASVFGQHIGPDSSSGTGSLSVADAIAGRRATALEFYSGTNWSDSRIANHMAGIDFSNSVEVMTIPANTTLVQYVDPAKGVGNYFAPVGTTASQLGINPAGRTATYFTTITDVKVLRSTAAPIVDTWTNSSQPYHASGKGTQYFTLQPNLFGKGN